MFAADVFIGSIFFIIEELLIGIMTLSKKTVHLLTLLTASLTAKP